MADDPYDLERFVAAQAPVIERVAAELAQGRKAGHWMWFVFPQFAGLGASALSQRFAIGSRHEAVAYLAHSVLGRRLCMLTSLVVSQPGSANDIFGSPDDMKFRSCMTLFAAVGDDPIFQRGLDRFFAGKPDTVTLALLDGT